MSTLPPPKSSAYNRKPQEWQGVRRLVCCWQAGWMNRGAVILRKVMAYQSNARKRHAKKRTRVSSWKADERGHLYCTSFLLSKTLEGEKKDGGRGHWIPPDVRKMFY